MIEITNSLQSQMFWLGYTAWLRNRNDSHRPIRNIFLYLVVWVQLPPQWFSFYLVLKLRICKINGII